MQRHGVRTAWFGGTAGIIVCLSLLTNNIVSAPNVALGASAEHRVEAVSASRPIAIPTERADTAGNPGPPQLDAKVDAIGDSVMADARYELRAAIPKSYIYAKVGRQPVAGIALLRSLRRTHRLTDVVVINLGTNGRLLPSHFEDIMNVTEGVSSTVIFVTVKVPRTWETYTNKTILAGVERYQDRAVLVDWHARWHECGGRVFGSDAVHLTDLGATCYASMIAAAVPY
jgi:hypothetical protein